MGWRLLLAALAGIALWLSFPPVGASVLAPLGVAFLTFACWRASWPRGLLLGLVCGLIFFAGLLRWMALIGGDAWIALSGFCALWIALLGLGIALVTRLPGWPVWVACLWVAEEALRDRIPLGGFAWGRLAFAQTATSLTPYAALAGAPAVTFATALAGALIALVAVLVVVRPSPRWKVGIALAIMGLLAVGLLGLAIPRPVDGQTAAGPAEAVGAVIQGGVPQTGLGEGDQRQAVLDRHVAATLDLARESAQGTVAPPQFVIWPENASDLDPFADAQAAGAITRAARAVEAPILVGAVIDAPGDPTRVANVGIVWDPQNGPGEVYIKRHPVPFGEYVPFRSLLASIISRFDRVPRDFMSGDAAGVLQVGPARVGDVICFEVAYDDVVRDAVVQGGRAIVVQTNNATFAGLGQPQQQIAMSRLRAVEHGRTVLVAATSGVSAVIDPSGRIIAEIGEGDVGSLDQPIALRDTLTLADRLGDWPELILALVGIAAAVLGAVFPAARVPRPTDRASSTAAA